METVLHKSLPFAPWADARTRRLPGILPLDMADWLRVDEVYAGQMRLRDHLIADRPYAVIAQTPQASDAVDELYSFTLSHLPTGFSRAGDVITRPDGVRVTLDASRPLHSLGRVVQQDLCLMQEDGQGEHLLSAPLWRANAHLSRAPLFNPLPEDAPKDTTDQGEMPFVRSERQCLLRLPKSQAVVFSIHTYLVRRIDLTPGQQQALVAHPIHRAD